MIGKEGYDAFKPSETPHEHQHWSNLRETTETDQTFQSFSLTDDTIIRAIAAAKNQLVILNQSHSSIWNVSTLIHTELTSTQEFYFLHRELDRVISEWNTILINLKKPNVASYLLSQRKIYKLTAKFMKDFKTQLSDDTTKIIARITWDKLSYYVIYSFPIVDPDSMVEIYGIDPLPIFHKNMTFLAYPSHPYVAINYNSLQYTPLSLQESLTCKLTPSCSAQHPTYMSRIPKCGLSDFFAPSFSCNPVPVGPSQAYFLTKQNMTFYSVPTPTNISILCSNEKYNAPGDDLKVEISGQGQLSIPPSCYAVAQGMLI
jgi:hypothetical protein